MPRCFRAGAHTSATPFGITAFAMHSHRNALASRRHCDPRCCGHCCFRTPLLFFAVLSHSRTICPYCLYVENLQSFHTFHKSLILLWLHASRPSSQHYHHVFNFRNLYIFGQKQSSKSVTPTSASSRTLASISSCK